jgi:hypothetical protein
LAQLLITMGGPAAHANRDREGLGYGEPGRRKPLQLSVIEVKKSCRPYRNGSDFAA